MTAIRNAEALAAALPSVHEIERKIARRAFIFSSALICIIAAILGGVILYQTERIHSLTEEVGHSHLTPAQTQAMMTLIHSHSETIDVTPLELMRDMEAYLNKPVADFSRQEAFRALVFLARTPPPK